MKKQVDVIEETRIKNLNNDILEYEQKIAKYRWKIQKLERKIKETKNFYT